MPNNNNQKHQKPCTAIVAPFCLFLLAAGAAIICSVGPAPALATGTSCSSSAASAGVPFADDANCLAKEKCTAPTILCCTCGSSSASSSTTAVSASGAPSGSSVSSSAPSSGSSSPSSSSGGSSSSPAPSAGSSSSSPVPAASSPPGMVCYPVGSTAQPSSVSSGSSASPAQSASSGAAGSSSAPSASSASTASPSASNNASSPSSSSSASPGGSTYPPEPCPCELINALVEFKYQQLNSSEQQIFEQDCLVELRSILVDVSLSIEEKIVQCGYVIRHFCAAHPSIGDKCKWVAVSGWGYVYDFAFVVCFAYEDELVNSVCQLVDNSTGSNNLTITIGNGTSGGQCGNSSVWSTFVSQANQLNRRDIPSMSRARQLAWYSQALEQIYFKQYPAQEQCIRNISLAGSGYNGTVDEFLDLCDWYNTESELLPSVLADYANATTAGQCPFLQSLQQGVSAANASLNSANSNSSSASNSSSSSSNTGSSGGSSYNSSTVQEAQSFVDYCSAQFASVTVVSERLQLVLTRFAQLSAQCRQLLKPIQIVGAVVKCMCADVIAIGNSCANGYACTNLTLGGAGESLEETCLVDRNNVSTLVQASANYMSTLAVGNRLSYQSYHNAIRNCCYSSQYNGNLTARYECANYYVTNWAGQNSALKAVYNKVQMYTVVVSQSVSNAFFGTFGCFCGCATCSG